MRRTLVLFGLLLAASAARAQDANITQPVADIERTLAAEPMVVGQARISRPAIPTDITLRADATFGGTPLQVKLRRAFPGAEGFNNEPRYEMAAYELQKLFLQPEEYVVPPTALRFMPVAELKGWAPAAARTFSDVDEVLVVVQYWLEDVKTVADVYDADRFAADPAYARHIGQLNILTFLIEHRDSNAGNFLIGRQQQGARVFSVDHGVAFASTGSDRGELWQRMRVKKLPADAIERLRAVTPEMLRQRLAVLAQWRMEDGRYVQEPPGAPLNEHRGVRRKGRTVQVGLTRGEINALARQLRQLLAQVDRGTLELVAAPEAAPGG